MVGTASVATSPVKLSTASTARAMVIVTDPKISSFLRGNLSMISVAAIVATKLTTPMPTDTQMAWFSGESEAFDEHLRQEIDHGVDADELLEQHDADRGDERRTGDAEQLADTALGVLRGDGLDLVELELHLRLIDVLANKGKVLLNASRSLPRLTRYRGDSGSSRPPISSRAAGTSADPSIHRQSQMPAILWPRKPRLDAYASRMPKVIISWNSVDSDPRRSFGASSARYAGVSEEAAPTARPRMMRATTIIRNPVDPAHARTEQEQYRRQNQQLLAAETIGQRADGQGSRAGTDQHG